MNEKKSALPFWETAIIALAFVGLCVWYFGRQSAFQARVEPSIWWHAIPAAFFVLLVWILVRRARRATEALKKVRKLGG